MKFEIFKNKRLQFVLAVVWLISSYLIVRTQVVNAANAFFSVSASVCMQNRENVVFSDCIDAATKQFSKLYKVTEIQLIDAFMLFITPIIFIICIVRLVKWINNYKQKS
jgi:hypothetical protein